MTSPGTGIAVDAASFFLAATLIGAMRLPATPRIETPLAALAALAALAGIGIEIIGVLWDTAMQQEIPLVKLSRVSSYDALGSFVLIPLGLAAAGPVAEAVGTRPTILGAAAISLNGDTGGSLRPRRADAAAPCSSSLTTALSDHAPP